MNIVGKPVTIDSVTGVKYFGIHCVQNRNLSVFLPETSFKAILRDPRSHQGWHSCQPPVCWTRECSIRTLMFQGQVQYIH